MTQATAIGTASARPTLAGQRAVIVDEWALLRFGIETVLRSMRVRVVSQEASGLRARAMAAERSATLAVVGLPVDVGPADAVRRLKDLPAAPAVAALLPSGQETLLPDLLAAGADAVLARGTSPEELGVAVEHVARGARFVGRIAARRLLGPMEVVGTAGQLTPREREVLQHLLRGRSNREIAEAMYLSVATVKTHLRNLYEKLGVRTRDRAVARAIEDGLLR